MNTNTPKMRGSWPLPEALFAAEALSGLKGLQGLVKGEEELTGKLQGGVEASSATACGESTMGSENHIQARAPHPLPPSQAPPPGGSCRNP